MYTVSKIRQVSTELKYHKHFVPRAKSGFKLLQFDFQSEYILAHSYLMKFWKKQMFSVENELTISFRISFSIPVFQPTSHCCVWLIF